MEDGKMTENVTIDDTMPKGVSEGGMPFREEDHARCIGPEPNIFGCLVRLTGGTSDSYQYRSATLSTEMAEEVTKGADPLDLFREAVEGDVIPGTELFRPMDSYLRTHAKNLRYAASQLNNGSAQPAHVVDSAFRNGRDVVEAIVALTATPETSKYGSSMCDF